MRKTVKFKYGECYMWVNDGYSSIYGNESEIQTMLVGLIEHIKKNLSEEDIMLAVNIGLKGKEYALEQLHNKLIEALNKKETKKKKEGKK